MNQHKENIVTRVAAFQVAVNALSPGASKTEMQSQLSALIQALASANSCGPLRVGIELPAAS